MTASDFDQPIMQVAENGRIEPDSAFVFLCFALSQHKKCGISEKVRSAAQRINLPFVVVAA